MLNGLILADGTAEHDPRFRVLGGALQRGTSEADGLRSYQDTLGIESI